VPTAASRAARPLGRLDREDNPKAHHLDRLRDSRGAVTVLVVDNAHEREDLGVLLR
jgi:hypothetical protein